MFNIFTLYQPIDNDDDRNDYQRELKRLRASRPRASDNI